MTTRPRPVPTARPRSPAETRRRCPHGWRRRTTRRVVRRYVEDLASARPPARYAVIDLWRPQPLEVIGQVQRDAAIAFAERFDADPDHFAGRHQRVEHGRVRSPRCAPAGSRVRARCRNGGALQLLDGVEQRLQAAPAESDAVPRRRRSGRARRVRPVRFPAAAWRASGGAGCEARRRRPTRALIAAGPEFAFDDAACLASSGSSSDSATRAPSP